MALWPPERPDAPNSNLNPMGGQQSNPRRPTSRARLDDNPVSFGTGPYFPGVDRTPRASEWSLTSAFWDDVNSVNRAGRIPRETSSSKGKVTGVKIPARRRSSFSTGSWRGPAGNCTTKQAPSGFPAPRGRASATCAWPPGTVLILNPGTGALESTLPLSDGGQGSSSVPPGDHDQIARRYVTMLVADMGVSSIPHEHEEAGNFLRAAFDGKRESDIVLCDGQGLRTQSRAWYRESRGGQKTRVRPAGPRSRAREARGNYGSPPTQNPVLGYREPPPGLQQLLQTQRLQAPKRATPNGPRSTWWQRPLTSRRPMPFLQSRSGRKGGERRRSGPTRSTRSGCKLAGMRWTWRPCWRILARS